jgi:hypothetical protein
MKTYGGKEIQLHAPADLCPGRKASTIEWARGWVCLRVCLAEIGSIRILANTRNRFIFNQPVVKDYNT